MDLGLRGRTALVTASSKGLGKSSALSLAGEGVNVVICARGGDALKETEREIADTGAEVLALEEDVTSQDAPERLAQAAVERFGSLDIVVANAGGPPPGRSFEPTDEDFYSAMNANFLTSVRLARAALPHMRKKGWGRLCFITSSSIKQPMPNLVLSNVSRTALWSWSRTAAKELLPEGITVNLVCPGLHATDRMKNLGVVDEGKPIGDPDDFGRIVAFLCSEHAKFVSGASLLVDGARVDGLL
jgi:3-oxoacyl-[acyl-carrier protein] reductase